MAFCEGEKGDFGGVEMEFDSLVFLLISSGAFFGVKIVSEWLKKY